MYTAGRDFRVVVVVVINKNNNIYNSIWDRQRIYNSNIKINNVRESKKRMMTAKNYLAPNECFYAYFIYSYKKTKKIISK